MILLEEQMVEDNPLQLLWFLLLYARSVRLVATNIIFDSVDYVALSVFKTQLKILKYIVV